MAYMMKAPLIMPEIDINPYNLPDGTKGLFVKSDGIYVLNDDGSVKKLGFEDHSIYKFRGNYTSGLYLPKNPEIGAVYNIIEKSYITLEASCAYFTGKFSDYFSFVYEDTEGNMCYEFSNGDVWENYRDYFIDTSGSGTYGETYVYNIDGTYAGGFPYAQATGSKFVNNLTGYKGNDTDIVYFFICPTYVSSGLTVIPVNAGENVAWTGTTWDSFGGLVDLSAYPTKTELNNALTDYYTKNTLDTLLDDKANKQTVGGGFVGGLDAVSEDSAVSVGKGAKSKNGGFAAGLNAEANAGGGVGMGAKAYNYGGAVGRNAVAGKGFSGGDGALAAQRTHGADRVNCIQLGEGINNVEKSLQVYEFQLMDGSGKIPVERLPETVTNSLWGGEVSSWEGLPTNPKPGMYCYVSSDIANGEKYTGKVSELFRFEPPEFAFPYPSTVWFTPPDECLGDTDFSETQKQVKIYTKSGNAAGNLWVSYEAYPTAYLDVTQLGATSADDTVTFYLGYWDGTSFPAKIENFSAGSMIFWNGTEWCGVASADLAGEVSGKADKIKTNPHGGIYGYPLIVTDHLAGESPISLKVYGASDGVGDLVASGDYTGKYAIPITIRGKNLFSTKSIQNTSSTINGITWTINDDGSITANGTATANSHYNAVKQADAILFPAGDYSFSTTYEHYNQIQFKIMTYVDGAATILTQTLGMDSPVFTLTDDTYLCFQFTIGSGKTLDNVTIYPRIEFGKVLTEYEPYGISTEKTVYADAPLTEGESVEITDIVMPESAKLLISANTAVPPSGMELLYYQDMNKLVGEFASGAHPLMGKKILCLGDSIFGTKNTEVSEFFKSITKANVYNCALGGTRMAQHEEGWDNWSMYRFAYSIANNDWAIQENGLSHTNVPPFAEERLAFIKTLDFNDIDVITINHGTNDWSGSITLDNDSNPLDTTTYMGALRYSVEAILTAYPHLKIVVLSPCWRYWKDSDGNFTNDSNTRTNTLGEALVSYVSKGKEVAESYQLDWVDLYHIGFNKFTTSIYFPSTDTTHPNNTGRLAIAKKMSECIRV